jgi:hypothetical protein
MLDFLLSDDAGDSIDLLVLSMDVDVAVAAGIENPPATTNSYVTKRLCKVVRGWLVQQRRALPESVVIGLPAMAIESWVIAALYPRVARPEAISNPAEYLASKHRLNRQANGKPAKPVAKYRDFAKTVSNRLDGVRQRCDEANRLCRKIEARKIYLKD